MVHALGDAWRVLVHGGTLVDLRPRTAKDALDLVSADTAVTIGHTDTTPRSSDDAAADAAVASALGRGLFALTRRDEFDIEIIWDSVADFERYMTPRAGTRVTPGYQDLEAAFQRAAARHAAPRLRAVRRLVLTAYERRQP